MRANVSRSGPAGAVIRARLRGIAPFLTFIFVLIAGALSSGCAIRLGPDYDKAIFDGLTKANEDAMTLFASVSKGGAKATYSSRKPAYDAIIGELDALSVQIQARSAPALPAIVGGLMPQHSPFDVPNLFPASSCFAAPATSPPAPANAAPNNALPVPTASAVRCLAFTITTMRDADARNGIGAPVGGLFKMRFAFFMTNALAYEKALNR